MQVALQTFFTANRKVTEGDLVADDDPVVAGRQHLFAVVERGVPSPIVAYADHARHVDSVDDVPAADEPAVFGPVDGEGPDPGDEPAADGATVGIKGGAAVVPTRPPAKKTAAKKTAAAAKA